LSRNVLRRRRTVNGRGGRLDAARMEQRGTSCISATRDVRNAISVLLRSELRDVHDSDSRRAQHPRPATWSSAASRSVSRVCFSAILWPCPMTLC